MKRNTWLLILAAVAVAMWILIPNLPGKSKRKDGAALARDYCTRCHEYPDPSMLQRDVWVNGVLPEMGLRLGIGDRNTLLNKMPLKLYTRMVELGVYPDTPMIAIQDWLTILAYYRDHSPKERIAQGDKATVSHGGVLFSQLIIAADSGRSGQTTMARFVPSRKEIWIGSRYNTMQVFDLAGKKKIEFRMPSPVVDAIIRPESLYLGIGNMLQNEDPKGRLFSMGPRGDHPKLILDSLHRPVQMLSTDLDMDGKKDMLVAEFGFVTGQVRLMNGRDSSLTFISRQPGARDMIIRDVDHDGLPDIFILFAQAREQVSLFRNLGGGRFEEKVLLKFPPEFGSSFMDMADMNGDGREDLIISNGDNADYSLSYKPYHGVRIFLHDGQGGYTLKWFHPSYGATKVISRDFDGDGDIDLVMSAFFSEPGKNGSFLYFENLGSLVFKPWDMNVPDGLWLVMESDDADGDGDHDLILGNFQFGPDLDTRPTKDIQALVLLNQTKR